MRLVSIVDEYYDARKYVRPNATESLLWLISEIGELAEAHMAEMPAIGWYPHLPTSERLVLRAMIFVGHLAECIVAMKGGWVRNNGRKDDTFTPRFVRVRDEIGDCLMMLTVYAGNEGVEPVFAMLGKFAKKGFMPKGRTDGSDTQPAV